MYFAPRFGKASFRGRLRAIGAGRRGPAGPRGVGAPLGGGGASEGKGGCPGTRKMRQRKRDAEVERSERPHARLPGGRGKLRGSAMAGREIAGGGG